MGKFVRIKALETIAPFVVAVECAIAGGNPEIAGTVLGDIPNDARAQTVPLLG